MEVKKDLAMRQQRNFSIEFKRQVVEELISGVSRPAQICRRYDIVPSFSIIGRSNIVWAGSIMSRSMKLPAG